MRLTSGGGTAGAAALSTSTWTPWQPSGLSLGSLSQPGPPALMEIAQPGYPPALSPPHTRQSHSQNSSSLFPSSSAPSDAGTALVYRSLCCPCRLLQTVLCHPYEYVHREWFSRIAVISLRLTSHLPSAVEMSPAASSYSKAYVQSRMTLLCRHGRCAQQDNCKSFQHTCGRCSLCRSVIVAVQSR